MASLFNKAKAATQSVQNAAAERYASVPSLTDATSKLGLGSVVDGVSNTLGFKDATQEHPHGSFAPITDGNNVKFHIAGCAYFWALSEAIEKATTTIFIQGLWVSPELYLRRPAAANEKYRLDRMLQAAAERGVQVRVMVWKEMPNTLPLESSHTKHALEGCHPSIQVFRHPDWYASAKGATSSVNSMVQSAMKGGISMDGMKNYTDDQIEKAISLANLPMPGWTHHEKLCVIDSRVAFIGGIDLCYGRYDPDAHPIADVHPDNVDETVWPGQDYNNGRIKDFHNLTKWERNDLDRQKSSRMGWQDIALSLTGPSVADVAAHYQHRWNFIYDKKYNTWIDSRYTRINGDAWSKNPSINETAETIRPSMTTDGTVKCQFIRSCSRWSNGTPTEHSIYNAYIETIANSEHFIYIENQFFVTKSNSLLPATIWNKIGEALANRVIRAAKEGKKFKVFVVMPSIMVYPGELVNPLAFPARLTMKLNYHSINRGMIWPTLFSTVKRAGYDPGKYFHFYNLRTYDRINAGGALQEQEKRAQASYAAANADHNTMVDAFGSAHADFEGAEPTIGHEAYKKYQAAASKKQNSWDSVSDCYMDSDKDIRNVPWAGNPAEEMDAFVSEQLYVHSKVLIADDRVIICGSANLNDRSMKGSRDSEAALYMEDTATVETTMDGKPYTARRLAAAWRRYLFRKYLGLLKPHDYREANDNFLPPPGLNDYDFDSANDQSVADPLSDQFLELWQGTAKKNSETFWNVFEPVPDNSIKTWAGYSTQALKRKAHTSGWGHVLTSKFSSGEEGAKQVKEELAKIRGMLIEMSMDFLGHDDIELIWWNPLTQIVSA